MADVVNATHKERLSQRNSEPSHIAGKAQYDVLGGPGISSAPGGDDYKIDAAKGVGTDSSIPKSVGAEASHLKTEEGDKPETSDGEVEVDFGEEDEVPVDDLDKELDEFEDIEPTDVDVDIEDDDELKNEEFEKKDDEDDAEKVDEEDEEDDEKKPVTESQQDGEEDGVKDDEKLDEEDEEGDKPDFLKKKDDEEDVKSESVKIRIKLPNAKLFESVGIPAKSQKRMGVLLESAIKDVTKQVSTQVQAHYKKLHEQKLAKRDAVMAKQMDAYLSYVVEEWAKQNKVAIRQSLRTQLAEEFLNGLQRLFKEHYIDVPESKVNVVAKLTSQVNKLKSQINEQVAQKMKLRKLAESANKARIVAEFARGLSESQTAKLQKLAENTEYTSAKEFRGKLTVLKENHFAQPRKLKRLPEENLQEAAPVTPTKKMSDDPNVAAIAHVLSAQAKRETW